MLIIEIKNGNIEGALKSYKKKVQNVKQIEELRGRQTYVKPSVQKRLVSEEAKRKNKINNKFI
jgi:small subunit ribosomal protein S21